LSITVLSTPSSLGTSTLLQLRTVIDQISFKFNEGYKLFLFKILLHHIEGREMKTWYLLYCKRNQIFRAEANLLNLGVECFFPKLKVIRILRGKKSEVIEPLFPSYLFARFDYEIGPSFTTVRSTRGVVDFVRKSNSPIEVNSELIFSLKKLVESNDVWDFSPKKGDIIKVKHGQFSGVKAVFHEPDGEARSVLLVELMNVETKICIENKDLDLT